GDQGAARCGRPGRPDGRMRSGGRRQPLTWVGDPIEKFPTSKTGACRPWMTRRLEGRLGWMTRRLEGRLGWLTRRLEGRLGWMTRRLEGASDAPGPPGGGTLPDFSDLSMTSRACPVCGSEAATVFAEQRIDPAALDGFAFASRKQPEYMHYRLVACPVCD